MWVFASVDSSEPDLKLLRKCTEYFSGIYKTVLVGFYESNMVILPTLPKRQVNEILSCKISLTSRRILIVTT